MRMNSLDDILRLLEKMAELPFESIEVTDGGVCVRVSRGSAAIVALQPAVAPAAQAPVLHPEALPEQSAPKAFTVASPIIGVFYAAPSPDDAPFAQAGDAVHAGQTLCIVEAMKLLNEIPSPISGIVLKVLAQDGGEVEVGQALFLIEPAEG
jgi:acetyl-CoA carboxylase biotin carboxyl carrier protein